MTNELSNGILHCDCCDFESPGVRKYSDKNYCPICANTQIPNIISRNNNDFGELARAIAWIGNYMTRSYAFMNSAFDAADEDLQDAIRKGYERE